MKNKEKKRRRMTGIITADNQDKTRVVNVKRSFRHPLYKKVLRKSKKYYVHDEENSTKSGDRVLIEECRPMSRMKRWRIVEKKR